MAVSLMIITRNRASNFSLIALLPEDAGPVYIAYLLRDIIGRTVVMNCLAACRDTAVVINDDVAPLRHLWIEADQRVHG